MIFTIAIDGPAAAGKGTLAKALAAHYNMPHLDTGSLYRAVAVKVLAGVAPADAARALTPADLAAPNLRSPEVGAEASRVAAIPEVRAALLAFQQRFALQEGGAVLDGRDVGTVIAPDAPVKLFVTASDISRAERRLSEFKRAGVDTDFETVLRDMQDRDARDAARDAAPMLAADDAITIDTSELTAEEVLAVAIDLIDEIRG
ncbi:(d)CMP kinase [Ketogulonicigenium vulgare]|uniref:Cytidylate kinase n=1 Tax=Ketogulonicigenium vulgare (strain WSH-001) TaxID=759362 RepID=F9Y3C6_KETVW|nr:(d)CMP kinase [Ketogulonicigenium vulgare]ADO42163.1 cytidylate kinase [Ketogulonicigenium vulgare Y25]AEM40367.1 Cytidylate kinase, putative [Ketogulonicigenium vulgare WSH-001]ALJ80556.1 cytidylate kinase [Ketogulonicigenium vulgare]ANW33377.1 cytidylate kinase [Ketogulonicigenium vulgare]AOZ54080.1 cytidylate kinase [Ketogulonicigenium vulgare]